MKRINACCVAVGALFSAVVANANTVVPASTGKPYYLNQDACFVAYSSAQVSSAQGTCHSGIGPNAFYWETYLWNSQGGTVNRTLSVYGREANPSGCVIGDCRSFCSGLVINANGDLTSWTNQAELPVSPSWKTFSPTLSVPAGNPMIVECYLSDLIDSGNAYGYVSAVQSTGSL